MNLPLPTWPTLPMLLAVMFAGEAFMIRKRLSGDASRAADRGSLRLLFAVIAASVMLASVAGRRVPQARFDALLGVGPASMALTWWVGLAVFVAGLALRWYAVGYLGRLFTYDVAIAADHRVVDTGPYRRIRHPSYTGSLLGFLGLGLCGGNALALAVLMVPIMAAFLHRIAIEEAALSAALGEGYRAYAARTKRLVPFVY